MSATNALTKSVHQAATPELCTSTIGSSRRKKALTLFARVRPPQSPPNRISPFCFLGNLGFPAFGICSLVISHLKCSPKNLKHFRSNLKCLALYQVLTKNFTQKPEMVEMLKCHFPPWPLRNGCRPGPLTGRRSETLRNPSVSCFEKIQLPFGSWLLLDLSLKRSLKRP
jgi:hypothetical protein